MVTIALSVSVILRLYFLGDQIVAVRLAADL